MPWVRFTAPFDFSPAARGGLVTIAYPEGMERNVTRECAAAAKAAGKAVTIPAQRKGAEDGDARRG